MLDRPKSGASSQHQCRAACTDTPHHNLPTCPIRPSPPALAIDLEPEAEETAQAFTAHGGNKGEEAVWRRCDETLLAEPAAASCIDVQCRSLAVH